MAMDSEWEVDQESIQKDSDFFKHLLNMIPARVYFDDELKKKLRGEDDEEVGPSKKKRMLDPLFQKTVSELQEDLDQQATEKQTGKKKLAESKKKQKNKNKAGNKKQKQKLKRKGLNPDERNSGRLAMPQHPMGVKKPIFNKEGKMVFSKFDFSESGEKHVGKVGLAGHDYKRLLDKLDQREEKIQKLRNTNEEAAKKVEEKLTWQKVVSKAAGEKVKDDRKLIVKSLKKKEKMKEKRKKKWRDREKTVKTEKKKKQDKRQSNIEKRKEAKKDKKRKKLIKKGRIIPGV